MQRFEKCGNIRKYIICPVFMDISGNRVIASEFKSSQNRWDSKLLNEIDSRTPENPIEWAFSGVFAF